jgi:hypothetical protein
MLDLHISHGADINACDEKGNTPLLLVHRLNWRVIMPTLLAHGAEDWIRLSFVLHRSSRPRAGYDSDQSKSNQAANYLSHRLFISVLRSVKVRFPELTIHSIFDAIQFR